MLPTTRRHPTELILLAFAALFVVALTVLAVSRLATDTLERVCDTETSVPAAGAPHAGC